MNDKRRNEPSLYVVPSVSLIKGRVKQNLPGNSTDQSSVKNGVNNNLSLPQQLFNIAKLSERK